MIRAAAVVAVLLAPGLLAGCTSTDAPPVLQVSMAEETIKWGQAAQLTIQNVGDGEAPAPITVRVVSANGTVVRTYEDIRDGRPLPAGGTVSLSWNGLDDAGNPVLWGSYTMVVEGYDLRRSVELLRPPHHAITVDPIPRESPAGEPMEFLVNNTGTTWANGTMTMAAGKGEQVLYINEVDVRLSPNGTGPSSRYSAHWNGMNENGTTPEPDKYLIAVRIEPFDEDAPTPFAQDVFTLTE